MFFPLNIFSFLETSNFALKIGILFEINFLILNLSSPTIITALDLSNPLRILSLNGPDGRTLLFPKPCLPSITIIEKSLCCIIV